jgi:hypothetical protein
MSSDLKTFFTTTNTIWISENFKNLILDKYEPSAEGDSGSMQSADLQEIESGKKVETMVFQNPDFFLEQLAGLIKGQINGEEGKLLNDSSANYFFVLGKDGNHYSILVRWEPAQKLWRCGAYLQEQLALPNLRIFYPN